MIEDFLIDSITGVQINYYFVCKKKLWYFSHGIQMEYENDFVLIGREIQEISFNRKRKEIEIGPIKIDFLEKELVAEVKKSQKLEEAHIWQLKYYLYYLEKLGVYRKGVLVYPESRKRISVMLDDTSKKEIEKVLVDIKGIISMPNPPRENEKSYCRNCAYYKLCKS